MRPLPYDGDTLYNNHVIEDVQQGQAFPKFHTPCTGYHLSNTLFA